MDKSENVIANEKYERIHKQTFRFLKRLSVKYEQSLYSQHTHDKAIRNLILYLFCECFIHRPKLIVELGTGTVGPKLTTNYIFEFISDIYDSILITVDSDKESINNIGKRSIFINQDDIKFGNEFQRYCLENNINQKIDLLIVDTEKSYDHMVNIIKVWFPYVSDGGIIIFHDTGTFTAKPWIKAKQAIEDTLKIKIDASYNHHGTSYQNGWSIRHVNVNKGLTILSKYERIKDSSRNRN